MSSKTVYNTLYQAFRSYLVYIVVLLLIGFLGRFLLLYNSKIIATTLDSVPVITHELLHSLLIKLIFVLAVSFAMATSYRVLISRLASYAISKIYDETTLRVSRFPLSFFDQQPAGKITSRFSSDYGNLFRLFGGPLAEFLSIIFDVIAIVIITISIHPLFAAPLSLATLFFFGIHKYNQKELRHARSEVSLLRAPSVAHFSETVQGATNIKLAGASAQFTTHFNYLDQIFVTAKEMVFKRVFVFSAQLNFMSFGLFILNGFLSIYLMQKNIIGIGQVSVVLSYTFLATQALQMFFEWFSQFDEAMIGVQRMDEYLRLPIEHQALLPARADFETGHPQESQASSGKPIHAEINNLYIHDLSLKYTSQATPTLKHLSLNIQQGQKVGIIGKTGSGKSSLISAIMKLYPYSSGRITINEDSSMSLEYYRSHFAVVSQDTFFIQGTLRENIDLFNLYTDEEVIEILQRVGIFLGLSDRIEERGANLSFGEKQLISLARCLLKDSPFIILDEATANIDPHSEAILTETLETALKNKTQIIVAHRLVTVEKCDMLIWIDQGQIKKIGSAKEVLEAFRTSG
jgi:ABC-type multidrug transport system fused ATPase/permease subunit